MAFSLIPKEEKFFDLFEVQANHICQAAGLFRDLLHGDGLDPAIVAKMQDVEHEADITTHEVIDKLNRTFVTPFDREDIHELASEMDDVVDLIQGAASRMQLYRLEKSTRELVQMGDVLLLAAETLKKAVLSLKDMKKPRRILDYCIEINRLENTGDQLLETALGKLFEENNDPIKVIKWKEIYEITETAVDRCEDIANTVESILVKQA